MNFLLLLLLLIPVFYLLWLNGMLVINCKRALLYLDVRAGAPTAARSPFPAAPATPGASCAFPATAATALHCPAM